jgi:hypothetical protein
MNLVDATYLDAVSEADFPAAAWAALEDLTGAVVGHKLFTVMTVDMVEGLARRAYTSHPAEYPVSGTKPIHHDAWFEVVHVQRKSFIANTIADIAQIFPDYELIASLGCGSVWNLPVFLRGELVATINMLHAEGHYTKERVAAAEERLALPARLATAVAMILDGKAETAA